ncbi:MAG TPA: hypothetical protein VFT22_26315 [Kofleriaceae bacterium]|nr:hypothetical protein [Kofleriaceae bacterium]
MRYGAGIALVGWLGAGCVAQAYSYQPRRGAEQHLAPVRASVVSVQESLGYGRPTTLSIPFATGRQGAQLVAEFLAQADARHAAHVADLAIYLQTWRDGQLIECRSEIAPESVTSSEWRPPTTRSVSVSKPVTRIVSEWVSHCAPVTRSELRTHTEYEQQCSTVTHPVQRSRTTYSTSYNSLTHSSVSTPQTEFYTDYQSSYECKSVPVTRTRSELVTETQCRSELETRPVTRYEFQLEQEYVPGHFETLTRQRLRELDPVCSALDETGPAPASGAAPDDGPGGGAPIAASEAAGAGRAAAGADVAAAPGADSAPPEAAEGGSTPVASTRAPAHAAPRPRNRIQGLLFGK